MEFRFIYLGRKGGGAEFFRALWNTAQEVNFTQKISFVKSNYFQVPLHENIKSLECITTSSIHSIIKNPFKFLYFIRESFFIYKKNIQAVNIFLMPSPLDWVFVKIAKIKKEKVIFLIHDAVPHSGDWWPNSRSIRWRIRKADALVTLSTFVTSQLKQSNINIPILTLWHPIFNFDRNKLHVNNRFFVHFPNNKPILLFIGRIKSYKGLEVLLAKENEINQLCNLVIAGEGRIPKQFNFATIINKWLSDYEFTELINLSQILIFPYKDASQSGIIPIAINFKKYIITSNAGALIEQIGSYENVEFFNFEDPDTLIRAISNTIHKLQENTLPIFVAQNPLNFELFLSKFLDFSLEISKSGTFKQ